MPELPQCWAYNVHGRRCEQPAGHATTHSYTVSWDDKECYNPSSKPPAILPPVNAALEAVVAAAAPPPPSNAKCVACQHQHRGGVCKCGCHEHIG